MTNKVMLYTHRISYDFAYLCNVKNNNQNKNKNKKTLIDTEKRLVVARGAEGGEGQMSERQERGVVKCMVMDV